MRSRGRPPQINHKDLIEILKKYKSNIIKPNRKVMSKLCPIWDTISKEINNKVSPRTLYSYVVNNRYDFLNKLIDADIEECSDSTNSDLNRKEENELRIAKITELLRMECDELTQYKINHKMTDSENKREIEQYKIEIETLRMKNKELQNQLAGLQAEVKEFTEKSPEVVIKKENIQEEFKDLCSICTSRTNKSVHLVNFACTYGT